MSDPAINASAPSMAMRRLLADALAARSLHVPPLPGVAAEVISSSLADDADASRLADLIQSDQGLASHVLRVVNSPALRAAAEIVSLRQATARLGMNRIREIALAAALGTTLYASRMYADEAEHASKLGLAAALWAKEIARVCRKNTETNYLCGLLHDVGTPVVLGALERSGAARLPVRDLIGLLADFARPAGELLAAEWRLPRAVVATIRCIDDFRAAGDDLDNVAIARVAKAAATAMLGGALKVDGIVGLDAAAHLNLYPDDIARLLDASDAIAMTLQSMLR